MAINWITPSGVLGSYNEETDINVGIYYEENPNITLTIISGEIPDGIYFNKVDNTHYILSGRLSLVQETTIYSFTVRATDGEEISDRYFKIIVESYDINWISPTLFATTTEYAYLSDSFKISNPNGNEKFIKISGKLPEGITINENGLCYGTIGKVETSTDYMFSVGVYVNNELKLQKTFIIEVKTLEDLNQPIWITQEGNIGKLEQGDESGLRLSVYEPKGRPTVFNIISGLLPNGLTLETNGYITGTVLTENQATWEFTASCSNGFMTITRTFNIITNEVSDADAIHWVSDENLGDYKIGSALAVNIEAYSSSGITYSIIAGNLPSGITMDKNGQIYGTIRYQNTGRYNFTVHAKTAKTESIKNFYFTLEEGLGKNALTAYLYINLEYLNDYNEIRNTFDYRFAYRTFDANYIPSFKPEVYVANVACYDKPLLQKIIQFNLPLYLTSGLTKLKQVIKGEGDEEEHLYDVFYKDFTASNRSPDEEYLIYESQKHYVIPTDDGYIDYYTHEPIEPTGTVLSEEKDSGLMVVIDAIPYRVGYAHVGMWLREEDRTIVYGNPKILTEILFDNLTQTYYTKHYYMDTSNKIYVEQITTERYFNIQNDVVFENIDTTMYPTTTITETLYYFRDPNMIFVNVPSIPAIRERLSQRIYVSQLEEDKWYDLNTEEIVNPVYDKTFKIMWDDEAKSYYINMDEFPEEVVLACYDDKTGELLQPTTWFIEPDEYYTKVKLLGENEYGDIFVDYHHFEVINKETHKPYRNVLFTFPTVKYPFMIDSYGNTRFCKRTNIEERNWYWFDSRKNIIDSNDLILENINDEDILNDGNMYIQFFDEEKESLPEWMGGEYFPKFELFYSKAGENYNNLLKVNNVERDLKLMNEETMTFYCLTFKPKFNIEISPFDVFFDYHTNKYAPHLLLGVK